MANQFDARVLYETWARHFDPNSPGWDRLPSSVKEAWIIVAAGARMLDSSPEPPPYLIPGYPYMASWHSRDYWNQEHAPSYPHIVYADASDDRPFVLVHTVDSLPVFRRASRPALHYRRIPGFVYAEPTQPPSVSFSISEDE
jgi:hypothetical protein